MRNVSILCHIKRQVHQAIKLLVQTIHFQKIKHIMGNIKLKKLMEEQIITLDVKKQQENPKNRKLELTS